MRKRKMRTPQQARQHRREIKELDLLRFNKSKGIKLSVEDKARLIELSKLHPERKPLASSIKKRKPIEIQKPLYEGTIVEPLNGQFKGTLIWEGIEKEVEPTQSKEDTIEALKQLHIKLITNNKINRESRPKLLCKDTLYTP